MNQVSGTQMQSLYILTLGTQVKEEKKKSKNQFHLRVLDEMVKQKITNFINF